MTFRRPTSRHLLAAVPMVGYLVIASCFALKLLGPRSLAVMSGIP